MLQRYFCLFLLFLCCQVCLGQSHLPLVESPSFYVAEFDLNSLKENQIAISMPFAKKLILNPEQKKVISEKVVIKIELIYTKYQTSNLFNQKKLNKNRLQELQKLVPKLFENQLWEFELISQTKGESREVCDKMFHGFVLTFRPNSTKQSLDKEANYLESLVTNMIKQDSLEHDTFPSSYKIKTRYDLTIGYVHDTIWYLDTIKPPLPPDFFYLQSLYKDTTVLSSFNRNKDWKNFIVVTDATGSMSPYNAQIFVWLNAQGYNREAKYFVFFNDGDETKSIKKKPLATKGIYVVENKGIKKIIKEATKCMRNGSGGGENMENDIEAIIEGIKYYPKVDEIVLIADNREIMRDYKFIKKINKPVHIILCGAEYRINIQYLDLARQTNGTVHTIFSDVTNLGDIKEGEHFFIDEKEYMFQKDRFHSVYERGY